MRLTVVDAGSIFDCLSFVGLIVGWIVVCIIIQFISIKCVYLMKIFREKSIYYVSKTDIS